MLQEYLVKHDRPDQRPVLLPAKHTFDMKKAWPFTDDEETTREYRSNKDKLKITLGDKILTRRKNQKFGICELDRTSIE